jgi:Fe-S cluster biogenesis protein NfuA
VVSFVTNEKYRFFLKKIEELYNKLHGVEARARVVEVKDDGTVVVEFTGTFCHTCGVRDWLEDFAYLAVARGVEARLVEMIEPEGEEIDYKRIGVFKFNFEPSQIGSGDLSGDE